MATISELENLVNELTATMPPPSQMVDPLENVIPDSGEWILTRAGAGTYAVRARFATAGGGLILVRAEDEIRGYPATVATALRFTLQVATASRHYWVRT